MNLGAILLSAALSFALGLLGGVLLERYRQKATNYRAVRDAYLAAMAAPGANEDPYLRFGAFQRAGAWSLSSRELRRLADEIQGRGFWSPCEEWRPVFASQPDFPRCALDWAKRKNVDFSKMEDAVMALGKDWDVTKAPKPPGGAGMMYLPSF